MFGNEDNSNIEINVDKGGSVKGTVSIDISEYKAILELAFKAAILKEAIFANAMLNYDGKSLVCFVGADANTVAKYLFPDEYAAKLEEVTNKEDGE